MTKGEKPCDACRIAQQTRDKTRRKPKTGPPACGTTAAYQRHLKNGEKPCEACTVANRAGNRHWQIQSRHGITREEKRALWELQGKRCAIGIECLGLEIDVDAIRVDHCHATRSNEPKATGAAVRGLACSNCNTLLGRMGDNLDSVRAKRGIARTPLAIAILDALERHLTAGFAETQRRLANIRAPRSL